MDDTAARILALLATGDEPDAVWLDGGPLPGARGLLGVAPSMELQGDALSVLEEVEQQWARDRARPWAGVLTYEAGVDRLFGRAPLRRDRPGVRLRRFEGMLRLSGDAAVGAVGDGRAVARLRAALDRKTPHRAGPWPLQPLAATLPAAEYRARVTRALGHIAAGETYQINLSQPFVAAWTDAGRSLPAWTRAADVYAWLRGQRPATMGALVGAGERIIVSNSPETLVDVRFGAGDGGGDLVRMWPIKGTRPRGRSAAEDAAACAELFASPKDRAEHVMIVDLVRNDLGRLCRPGTVHAAATPTAMTLPTVHHLVTEVRGTLRPGVGLHALVEATFPGGSITGAPKRRTCELIETLEDHVRGVYCGAVVLLEPDGLRMSIPIRTGELSAEGLQLCAGGGIVIDSEPEAERCETLVKTLAFAPPDPACADVA